LVNRAAIERVQQAEAQQRREFENRLAAEASVLAERIAAGKLTQLEQGFTKRLTAEASVLAERIAAGKLAQLESDAAKAHGKRVKALEGALQQVQEEKLQLERRLLAHINCGVDTRGATTRARQRPAGGLVVVCRGVRGAC
jgi:hypothetical protein